MADVAKLLEKSPVRYWEVRSGVAEASTVRTWNKEVKELSQFQSEGYSVRVLVGNGWGFSHSTKEDWKALVGSAVKIATVMNIQTKKQQAINPQSPITINKETDVKTHPYDISMEEKKELLLEAANHDQPLVVSAELSYQDLVKTMHYYNSEGSAITQSLIYSYAGASITAKDTILETYYQSIGATKGYDYIKQGIFPTTDYAIRTAVEQLRAIVPQGGTSPVIADPGLTDVFVHEAIGHSAEADHVLQGITCLDGKMKTQIAPRHVTIVDDATLPGAWGSFFYDDEGIAAQKTVILDSGKVNSFLHSRETAAQLHALPTGNARAQDVAHQPIVRMSNTYIQKGDASVEELTQELKNGFFLIGSRGGEVDPAKGTFQFSCQTGFIVKNGELAGRVKGVSLGGKTLETLQQIGAISKNYKLGMPGFCGKDGQSVPVIGNCPHIIIKKAQVGGK